ncbi:MAG TPA: SMP-30/gluconolactonase/LRE family protein, partial [Pseudolysinimonas sp.]|nr:SMP-30/gluconolactonase/LRE family protein [Pseudolysinimonas sp.]
DDAIKFNEGGCDPLGRMYCGTMAYDETPGRGVLYRMDVDHSVRTVLDDVTISNGLQWSADGRRAFYIDTPTGRVDVFDVAEDGELANRRPFVTIEDTPGHPDGMAIDDEDGIWVALWGGAAVRHFDAAGRLVEQIDVPGASHTSACAFGGPDRSTLFITTSRLGLPEGAEPDAGALFAVDTAYRGATLHAYAG